MKSSKEIKVFQEPAPVLREQCAPIALSSIGDQTTQDIIAQMKQALRESGDGVAIAAPQIGHPIRIFVVAGEIIDHVNNYHGEHVSPDKVFINPEITKRGRIKKDMKGEGCLSVRWIYGTTTRSDKVTVKALDENGKEFTMVGTGLLAQIFQHETDHLNGILFIDHAHDIREMGEQEKLDYQAELEKLKQERANLAL
jgi:peptide deformylase